MAPVRTEAVPSIDEIHQRLVECAKEAVTFDIRPFENRGAQELIGSLAPSVRKLLDEALALNSYMLAWFDEEKPSVFSSEPSDADARLRNQIADFAFLCSMELRHRMAPDRLAAMEDGWDVIIECGITLQRVIKACTVLEPPLAALSGREPQLGAVPRCSESLETRRQYARLFRAIEASMPVDIPSLTKAMRRVGTAIAMLVGH